VHVVAADALVYFPAMHMLQLAPAGREYVPGLHATQTLAFDAAVTPEESPAAQLVQNVRPATV